MKRLLKFLTLALILITAGCIISGNILVVVKLPDKSLKSNQDTEMWEVSKDNVGDWADHFDDINHIVDVGFTMIITNNNTTDAATGQFYISKRDDFNSAEEVKEDGILLLSGLTVSAGKSLTVKWQESYDYLSNFDALKKYAMTGQFYVYAIGLGESIDIDIRRVAVILTINAKP